MPKRLRLVALIAAAALTCASPAAADVIVHRVSAGFEDGIPGVDPTATSTCESNICVGGTRNGQGCGQPRDCPSTLDNELVWQAGHIHVVTDDYSIAGPYDPETNRPSKFTLNIQPGAIVKIADTCELDQTGAIVSCNPTTIGGGSLVTADGSVLRIDGATITDIRDDSIGGDTNKDGTATTPSSTYLIRFGGTAEDFLSGNTIRYAALVGHFGSSRITGNTFEKFGGLGSFRGSSIYDTSPPVRGGVTMIDQNSFEIVSGTPGPGAVDVSGTSAIVHGNLFTGNGEAVRIGPAWEDPYTFRDAIPEAGRTVVSNNTIRTRRGIVVSLPGGDILEQAPFRADIFYNTLEGTGAPDGIGMQLAVFSETFARFNTVRNYAIPLQLNNSGVTLFPASAATAARMQLSLHGNSFSTEGATSGATPNLDAYWQGFGVFVDAENNWWGHETGPYDLSPVDGLENARGEGLALSNGIDYRPFLGRDPEAEDSVEIAAGSDPAAPIPNADSQVTVNVAADYHLRSAPTGTLTFYLRNDAGDILNPPGKSFQVTSALTVRDSGPIVVQLPMRSSAIRAEAVLVPDLSGGEQTRSNVVALAIKKPKPDFRLTCVADPARMGTCAPATLLPGGSTNIQLKFRYSSAQSPVDVTVKVQLRSSTGQYQDLFEEEYQFEAGFLVDKTIPPFAVDVPVVAASQAGRSLVVTYSAERADSKNDIGEGTREIPILEAANGLLIQNVSALDTNGSERGNPGHMLVGEHPTVELDVVHRIGTKNVTDWIVSVTGAVARNAAGAVLQEYQMDPSLVSGLLSTGAGKLADKTLQSFAEPVLPANTRTFTLSLSLRDPALLVNVATATVTIPVRNAGEVVQKEFPAGPSTISFSPIPGKLEIDAALAGGIFLFHYFLEPIEPENYGPPLLLQGAQERFATAPAEIAATAEEERLIPLNSHFALYDSLRGNGLDARVIFTYDPEQDFPDDPAFDEDALVIAALNPLSGQLEVLPSVHDKQAKTVSADYDGFFSFWTIASLVTTPAGVCADPTADGQITASDALFALRTSVGLRVCAACICDVNQSGTISAADALLILRFAVVQNPVPSCVGC